ncbi:ERF family protein [Oceanobacillus oncorhynchi]|uniref:ERF family protein n=1 Tax=Oceanobacillus oncorhynchi TaxID=545501 RepID=UPI001865AC30|nr:ERF family protein [Oceanobacillus oncorhynchi]
MAEINLTQKLLEVQKKLKAPKGQWNQFSSFYYRSAEDILESVKPLNAEQGLLLTLTDEPILIGEWHYIKATATITDGNDSFSVTAYARESAQKKGMDDSQITGTASSYARKYAMNGLYLIDDTKDADTDEYQKQSNQKHGNQSGSSISEKQINRLYAIGKKANVTVEDIKTVIMNKYNKTEVSQLTKKEYEEICSRLENKGA